MLAGLVSPEASLRDFRWPATFSLGPLTAFTLRAIPGVSSSSFKNTSHIELGPLPMISFELNYHFKGPEPKYDCPLSHVQTLGVGASTHEF